MTNRVKDRLKPYFNNCNKLVLSSADNIITGTLSLVLLI